MQIFQLILKKKYNVKFDTIKSEFPSNTPS